MPVNTEEKRFSTAEMQRTLEDRKRRHKRQAVTGVCVCTALLLPCIIVCVGLSLFPPLPWWGKALAAAGAAVCIVPLIFSLVVLIQRFKEIKGGELDAAAEY